jgi:hypothetical protein
MMKKQKKKHKKTQKTTTNIKYKTTNIKKQRNK